MSTIFILQIISKPNEHHNIKETSGKRTDDLKRKNSLENNKSPVKKVKCRYNKMRVAFSSPDSKFTLMMILKSSTKMCYFIMIGQINMAPMRILLLLAET